ncbi:glycosyltransferase family 4 protein [Oceanobacillus sp. AG]|uniref:glycosyltransferase family 4 protein n=1 Tax=Oceanobacillus sp. AG TaxID=2681969 RepID=UPI0012EC16DB|nr:glycosyltransferase family 4 protein [Oceanobacillus sp. AG]
MRIAYISNSIIPSRSANSIHVMKMCQAFSEKGHQVNLIAPDFTNTEPDIEDIYSYYGVKNSFEITKLQWKSIKGGGYLYGWNVANLIKEMKPDLIYGRFLTGCYFSSRATNYPVIYESHKPIMDAGRIQQSLFNKTITKENFNHLVVISESLQDHYLKNYNLLSNKVVVAHDGADKPPKNIESVRLLLDDSQKVNVGYLGHLYSGKGMELISKIAKECRWANFHIFGGTEEDIYYWKSQLNNIENIKFYGFIPHSDTPKYIKSCDILLAPYNKKVQGHGGSGTDLSLWMSPLKIFEYMSLGKAIISSDLQVLREVLNHGENSLLCDPENIDAWIQAIKILSNDKKLRAKIGENAFKDFKTEYTWNSRATKVLNTI